MHSIFKLPAFLLIPLITISLAHAAPDASSFKRLSAAKAVSLKNCVVTGATNPVTLKASLVSRQATLSLPASYQRGQAQVGAKGVNFAACGASDIDPTQTVLFLKTTKNASPVEYPLTLSQFEQSSVGKSCKSIRSWPGSFIYKTIGSHHFTDIRRKTIGLVMKYGANVSTPSCIDVIAKDGTKVGDFGFYSRGAGWFARYYGGIGCGDAINGATLATRARRAAGSDAIYARIGSVCYGPISASRCVGSKAC